MSTDHPRGQDDTPTPTTPLAAVAPQHDGGPAGSGTAAPQTPGGSDGAAERGAQAGSAPMSSTPAEARGGDASARGAQDAENPVKGRHPVAGTAASPRPPAADDAVTASTGADAGHGAAGDVVAPSTHGWSADHGHAASRHLPHEELGIAQPLAKSDALLDRNRRGRGQPPYALRMPEARAAAPLARGTSPHQAPSVPETPSVPQAADVPEVPSLPEPSTVPQAPEVPQTPTLEDTSREAPAPLTPEASAASGSSGATGALHAPAQPQEAGQAPPRPGLPPSQTQEPAEVQDRAVAQEPTGSQEPAGGVARVSPATASQRRIIVDDMPEAEPIMMDAATPEEPLSDEEALTAEPEPSSATTGRQAVAAQQVVEQGDQEASALPQSAVDQDAAGTDGPAAGPAPQEARPGSESARDQEPPMPGTAASPAGAAPAEPLIADAGAAAPTVAQAPRTPEPERALGSQNGPAPERALDSQGVMKPDGALESEALPAAGAEAQTASTSSTPPLQARVAPAAQGAAPALSTGAGAVVEESAPVEPAGAAPRSAAPSAPSEPAPTEVPEAAAPDAAMPEAPASTSAAPVPAADSRAVARPVTATAPLTAQQRPAEPLAAEPPAAQPPPEGLPSEAEPVPAVPPVSSSAPSWTADSSAPHEPATPTREPAAAPRLASDDEAAEAAAGEAQAPAGEPVAVQEPQDSLAAFAPLPAPPKAASPAPAARTRDRDSDPEPTAASPESPSERDILLEGASSLTRPPRRTASHWAGVLLALVLLPVAWFLVNDGARALTGGDATAWPAAVSMQGVLELGAGALLLCLALLMAHRSSLGALVLGGISLLIGLPFVVAPGAVASLLGPTVERLQAHSELGEALATYAMTDGLTGRFALMGLVIIMVGLVAHTSRRAGRREQAAAEQNNEGSTSLDFLIDERS